MSRLKGFVGEEIAVAYLKKKGYSVIDRNVSSLYGEIDIICSDKENCLVFVEVKRYKNNSFVHPVETITPKKAEKISATAMMYMEEKNINPLEIRFDLVVVGEKLVIQHIYNVFS